MGARDVWPCRSPRSRFQGPRSGFRQPLSVDPAALRPDGFQVICRETDIGRQLEQLREHAIELLGEVTIERTEP
jgi:hypothetical protein